jgi:molybdenum cofactor cytidylyltransferase
MLDAIVLAAGASRRMGSPKALLKIGEKTFLRHIVDLLATAGLTRVTVVLGADEEKIRPGLDWFGGTTVLNQHWQEGQLSSIIAGVDALEPGLTKGAMICPVDHPLLTTELLLTLVREFETSHKRIVVPTHEGRRGHPVIFAASLFPELRLAPRDAGARTVLHNHPGDIEEVPTLERGVGIDIATMEDYKREIVRLSS